MLRRFQMATEVQLANPLLRTELANTKRRPSPAKRFWNWYAKFYGSVENLAPHKRMINAVAALVPDSAQSILDMGCGSGALLQELRKSRPDANLSGIDFSDEMLARAQKRVPDFDACQGNLDTPLSYSDAQFDCIVCTNALYAVDSPQNLVSEMLRVVKKSGVVVVSTPKRRARGTKILRGHLMEVSFIQGIIDMARFATCVIPNVLIERYAKDRRYHFLTRNEVENLGGQISIHADTFADQNWLFTIAPPK
ncbi:23S rRNA (guanine(745)-N(1))-methyltransferase [Rubripirellula lacrimiformis]|uniref:23S rRNA (Guanine(745)-N(1))-methyltransferase n=1 Tax=Rubripirellula lacrimiformis TaxID=1930273 RepID=A0A517NGJ9_9BACT|nr:class I SAM-dependent methyltransferase [Rubripirellula lacrimiformis]QDT06266.1 23S rRNA (guanine(745)-N(1))-methyltransferase [Rubripirellula lacrimiformis]